MSAKTWLLDDVKNAAGNGLKVSLASALLVRIVREAGDWLGGALSLDGQPMQTLHGPDAVECMVGFRSIERASGHAQVQLHVEARGREFQVRVGAEGLGYKYAFGHLQETPADLFLALFVCAVMSVKEDTAALSSTRRGRSSASGKPSLRATSGTAQNNCYPHLRADGLYVIEDIYRASPLVRERHWIYDVTGHQECLFVGREDPIAVIFAHPLRVAP